MVTVVGKCVGEAHDYIIRSIANTGPTDVYKLIVEIAKYAVATTADELNGRQIGRVGIQRLTFVEPQDQIARGNVQDVAVLHEPTLGGNHRDQVRRRGGDGKKHAVLELLHFQFATL